MVIISDSAQSSPEMVLLRPGGFQSFRNGVVRNGSLGYQIGLGSFFDLSDTTQGNPALITEAFQVRCGGPQSDAFRLAARCLAVVPRDWDEGDLPPFRPPVRARLVERRATKFWRMVRLRTLNTNRYLRWRKRRIVPVERVSIDLPERQLSMKLTQSSGWHPTRPSGGGCCRFNGLCWYSDGVSRQRSGTVQFCSSKCLYVVGWTT